MTETDPAEWWCWTHGEPATFRCRERHHDVRPGCGTEWWCALCPTSHPTREALQKHGAESHSAIWLERLTRAEQQRDEIVAELKILQIQLAGVLTFASAYQPGGRDWQVMSDGEIPCACCNRQIRRGEAARPLADAKGYFCHVFCDVEDSPATAAGANKENQ